MSQWHLGGVVLWELGQDYYPESSPDGNEETSNDSDNDGSNSNILAATIESGQFVATLARLAKEASRLDGPGENYETDTKSGGDNRNEL